MRRSERERRGEDEIGGMKTRSRTKRGRRRRRRRRRLAAYPCFFFLFHVFGWYVLCGIISIGAGASMPAAVTINI
eukprot:3712124-Rhodomonas_salina.2